MEPAIDVEPIYNQLCSLCQDLFSKEPVLNAEYKVSSGFYHERRHHHFRDFEQAVRDGCHICNLLYGQLSAQSIDDLRELEQHGTGELHESTVRLSNFSEEQTPTRREKACSWYLRMSYDDVLRDGCKAAMRLNIVSTPYIDHLWKAYGNDCPSEANFYKFAQPRACETNSSITLDQVRAWLRECLLNHDACESPATETSPSRTLPSRLIDSGPLDKKPCIKLIDSSNLTGEVRYVALSHCWGGTCPVTLTKRTAALFTCHIKASTLPKTFRDAVWLARQIGIRTQKRTGNMSHHGCWKSTRLPR